MTTLEDLFPLDDLMEALEAGYVRKRMHPSLRLAIYTYTEKAVYAEHWTPVTRQCRGLITDDSTNEVVAWPFPKFFNYSEHANGKPYASPLPDLPFTVSEKMDGSLGIVFYYAGRWHVATKGSFASDQANWARWWLHHKDTSHLIPGVTYLTEIIYPENRIVVDYDDLEGLVLLGAYDSEGQEMWLDGPGGIATNWHSVSHHVSWPLSVRTLDDVVQAAVENRTFNDIPLSGTEGEGWVVRFDDGTRVKVKTADYVRLHGTLTRTNARTIWEALSQGSNPSHLMGTVPDEFRDWVSRTVADLSAQHTAWCLDAEVAFARMAHLTHDRKAFALEAAHSPHRAALFMLLDGRSIDELAWKVVRPEPVTPFDREEKESGETS